MFFLYTIKSYCWSFPLFITCLMILYPPYNRLHYRYSSYFSARYVLCVPTHLPSSVKRHAYLPPLLSQFTSAAQESWNIPPSSISRHCHVSTHIPDIDDVCADIYFQFLHSFDSSFYHYFRILFQFIPCYYTLRKFVVIGPETTEKFNYK